MMIAFIVALAMGQRAAAAHSVRGGAAPEHKLEDADGLVLDTWENEQEDRMLANVRGYELQGEDQYSSCPEGYPSFGKLGELLKTWNPNQADVPEAGVIERLQVSGENTRQKAAESVRSAISVLGRGRCLRGSNIADTPVLPLGMKRL